LRASHEHLLGFLFVLELSLRLRTCSPCGKTPCLDDVDAVLLANDMCTLCVQLIRPEEMCSPGVDELSMMTYLSQFPSAKLKQGAPLRPRTNPGKVRAYGPGIDTVLSVCLLLTA